jgi:hypothetical protein
MERSFLKCLTVAVAVLGMLAVMAVAQDDAAPVDRVDELLAMTPADIQALDADEREALAQEVEALVIEKNKEAVQLSQQLQNARQQARLSDPAVKEYEVKLVELQRKLQHAIDQNPDVRQVERSILQGQKELMELMSVKSLLGQKKAE